MLKLIVSSVKSTDMRKNIYYGSASLLTVTLILFLLPGCFKDHITRTYVVSRPVYASKVTVLASINGDASQPIVQTGKIYIKDKFIFLNDIDKGIHIFDNSDPSHPVQTAFLNIPGNEDIAVKGNILYADMYGDLLAIDITDLHHVQVMNTVRSVFRNQAYFNGRLTILNGNFVDSSQVITGWITKDTTVSSNDPTTPYPIYYSGGPAGFYLSSAQAPSNASSSGNGATGVAGSMAKMVVVNDYLYAITESHSLGIISVKSPATPSTPTYFSAGTDLETIYPFQDKLFLGSSEGVFMYDISKPAQPVSMGTFMHGRACDPVVTDGKYAYVTLHSGTSCGGTVNELDIVDVNNFVQSSQVKTYPMTNPRGLSKDGNLLFVCDGGVKVYDAADPLNLKLLTTIGNQNGYDVMSGDHLLMIVTDLGLYQYRYDDNNQFSQLSFLSAKK
jgi:hypothetical protein